MWGPSPGGNVLGAGLGNDGACGIEKGAESMQSNGKSRVSAGEVERAILVRIATGNYPPAGRLPTCEQLAVELSVNKNTVNKAYRSLTQRGYLRSSVGRGTYVVTRPPQEDHELREDLSHLVGLVVQEAKMAGLSRPALEGLFAGIVDRHYDGGRPRVGFIECNRLEAVGLSRDLQLALSHPVQPLLVDHVLGDLEATLRDFDILAINVNHLTEIEGALTGQDRGGAEIVPLLLVPDPAAVTEVARLPSGCRVGIVCDLLGTLNTLLAVATAANPRIVATGCLTSDPGRLRDVIASSEVVLLTKTAREHLAGQEIPIPTLDVSFQIDSRSVRSLADRVVEKARKGLS